VNLPLPHAIKKPKQNPIQQQQQNYFPRNNDNETSLQGSPTNEFGYGVDAGGGGYWSSNDNGDPSQPYGGGKVPSEYSSDENSSDFGIIYIFLIFNN
jgi:hypothetical protein